MKSRLIAVLTVLGGIAAYLIYANSEAVDAFGFFEWLRSLATRAALAFQSRFSNIAGDEDPMTKGVSIALDFIASKEGFSARAYPDPPGQRSKFSIGYGHQIVSGDGLSPTSVITESEAYDLLSRDVQASVDDVTSFVTADLTANQLAALISFRYNVGSGAFQGSTLVSLLNSGDYAGASEQFGRWVYANGAVNNSLVQRRNAEQSLFNS